MKFDSVLSSHLQPKYSPLEAFALSSIDTYQKHISARLPARCPYFPTCSHYGKQAIQKYGVVKGGYLAAARLWRCRPGMGGYDPVPRDEEERILSLSTWRMRLRSEPLPISWNFKSRRKKVIREVARTFDLILCFPNVLDSEKIFPEQIQETITGVNSQNTKSFYISSLKEVINNDSHCERFFRIVGEVKLPYLQSKASFEKALLKHFGTHFFSKETKGTIYFATYGLPESQDLVPRSNPDDFFRLVGSSCETVTHCCSCLTPG